MLLYIEPYFSVMITHTHLYIYIYIYIFIYVLVCCLLYIEPYFSVMIMHTHTHINILVCCEILNYTFFRCYTVHVVKSLNYFTNHCTYINLQNLHIKTLKTLRHVSVLGPSSGSYIVLAKVTLLKVILISLFQLVLWRHAVFCCVAKRNAHP